MISFSPIEYANRKGIFYRIDYSTQVGSVTTHMDVGEAHGEAEAHKALDHYIHASDHNLKNYPDCPWCRHNQE